MMMLWLHLFSNEDTVNEQCFNFLYWGRHPLSYTLTKLASMCVPIYIIIGGYGLAATYRNTCGDMHNLKRATLLMINFWLVFLIFVPMGMVYRQDIFPGSLTEFVLNLTAACSSYNGAWWFLLPYVILVLCSQPLIRRLFKADKLNIIYIVLCFLILYISSYIAKDHISQAPDILPCLLLTIVNFAYFLFIFGLGILAYRYDVFSRLRIFIGRYNTSHVNIYMITILLLLCLLRMIIGKSALLNFPFVCLMIPIFVLLPKPQRLTTCLLLIGKHSTNMWLCHFFFINDLLNNQIFLLRYPLLIWGTLMTVSLATSMLVTVIFTRIKYRMRNILQNQQLF